MAANIPFKKRCGHLRKYPLGDELGGPAAAAKLPRLGHQDPKKSEEDIC